MVSTKELNRLFRSLGQNPTEAEVQDMVRQFDTDGQLHFDFIRQLSLTSLNTAGMIIHLSIIVIASSNYYFITFSCYLMI